MSETINTITATDALILVDHKLKIGQTPAEVADWAGNLNLNGDLEVLLQRIHDWQHGATVSDDDSLTAGGHLTDLGNAHRFAERYRCKVLHSHELHRWFVYRGGRWVEDNKGHIRILAKKTVLSWYEDISKELDDNRRKDLVKHATSSEQDKRITAMLNLAQSEHGIPIAIEELDGNAWVLNVKNGTVDLRTGQLHTHNPKDLITHLAPVIYDAVATCPEWYRFLDTVTGSDEELITLLKRAVGMSLTGDTRTQVLLFLYGLGNNGKSTFLAIIRKMMGSYGLKANMSLFTIRSKGENGPNESLANLRGKRFVMASEMEESKRLAVATIKDITGGEPIRADRKYEHEIEFEPTFKLWLSGNHKPIISDTTYSIWRRFKLVPFQVNIDKPREDYPLLLEAELPGILNWAIEGCLEWQRYGLGQAEAIRVATYDYRQDQDALADFLTEACVLDTQATTTKPELFEAYQEWAKINAGVDLGKRKFGEKLTEKGIQTVKGHGGKKLWRGIRRREKDEEGDLGDLSIPKSQDFPPSRAFREKFQDFNEDKSPKSPGETLELPQYNCPACSKFAWGYHADGSVYCTNCHPEEITT